MAQYKNKDLKIVIDDVAVSNVTEYSVVLDTYDMDLAFLYQKKGKPNIKVTIYGVDFKIEVSPDAMKSEETEEYIIIYLYGVLEKVFPSLFKDIVLEPWQKAFIKTQTSDLYERAEIRKDNAIFKNVETQWFKKGWDAKDE